MKKVALLLLFSLLVISFSCNKDKEFNTVYEFTFNWDGTPVTYDDFSDIKYKNEFGTDLSITKMRFLISNIVFHGENGEDYRIPGYNFVDVASNTGIVYTPETKIPEGKYDVSFTFGFDTIDNKKSYPDLNSVNWFWPENLGRGYHFMQYEGKFITDSDIEQSYALHIGTARVSEGVFEDNHFDVSLGKVEISNDTKIEIKMNIAEWFKNPYTWDLNKYSTPLMPNYDAQILMNKNGRNVFSLGTVD